MNIMFVCTGNTCRSAMAEGLAKKEIKDKNLDINVSSSGIFAMKGEHASFNSVAIMKEYDVDIVTHTATPIEESNIEQMDYIFCATKGHKNQVIVRYPNLKDKVYTMKEYTGLNKDEEDTDISDPWGFDINTFRMCAAEISLCVDKIIEKIANERGE
ncbi:MAG: low molecular weight protein arginine phosphatase [Bacilli bacterium]|nr:low molecular weight protein arginine phosphatase [Clostridia bacterium]MBR3490277.1 low molecular weight protein arginine phosphatase [Bacilli bacterium]